MEIKRTLRVILLCPSPLTQSGVTVLASRWSKALTKAGWPTVTRVIDDCRPPFARRWVVRALESPDARLVILGLPAEDTRAQDIVDTINGRGQVSLLWERPGRASDFVGEGLSRLGGIRSVWTVNPMLCHGIGRLLPMAKISVAPTIVPQVYFRAKSPGARGGRYAAFVGRYSHGKGADLLARAWASDVYPRTHLPLVMAGLGLNQRAAEEHAVTRIAEENPIAVRTVLLMSDARRAEFFRKAAVAIFPARYDYLPQALLEAMATGVAVIATEIPGHLPVAEPHVTSYPVAEDLSNLGHAVRILLGDRDMSERLSRAAHLRVRLTYAETPASLALRTLLT